MKNMTIRAKMIILMSIIGILLLVVGAAGIICVEMVAGKLDDFYAYPFKNKDHFDSISENLNQAEKNYLHAVLAKDEATTKAKFAEADKGMNEILDETEGLKSSYEGDISDITKIEGLVKSISENCRQIEEAAYANDVNKAYSIYNENVVKYVDEAYVVINEAREALEKEAVEDYEYGDRVGNLALIVITILAAVALAASVFIVFYLTKLIGSGINAVKKAAEKMTKGDFHVEIKYGHNDEIGHLADSMKKMCDTTHGIIADLEMILDEIEEGDFTARSKNEAIYVGDYAHIIKCIDKFVGNMAQTLREIDEAANQVATGSEQVSQAAQALAQGTTEQASAVEQLASSLLEITDQISNNTHHAEQAMNNTKLAVTEMEQANDQMNELVSAMDEIRDCSDKISQIMKTIEDIAFQTNILALNAAIEAARAGEAGKGFAVVADEVRNLAGKSAEASGSTAVIIDGTIKAVERGNVLVERVAGSMKQVAEVSGQCTELNTRIYDDSHTATNSVNQVNIGIDQISTVVQTNAATSEQSASAAEEMSSEAVVLKDLIKQFKLA